MSYIKKLKNTQGFTLIELLVVIAIIGILSSVVLASLNGARQSGRDARRQSDLTQIRSALEMCASEKGTYDQCGQSTLTGEYIQTWPSDPTDGQSYNLSVSSSGYCIEAPGYEDTSNLPDNDSGCGSGHSIGPGTS